MVQRTIYPKLFRILTIMLEIRNVNQSIGGRKILNDVSLTVNEGNITCLIGPSGGGKSMLLRAIALIDQPTSGSVRVDDDTYQFPTTVLRAPPWPKVSIVFQNLFLWPHKTLLENILLPHKRLNAEQRAYCDKLIDLLDMKEFINRYPNQTSSGQRQRVALARTLLLRPRYLLLDEVSSALDVEQIAKLLVHLKELRRQGTGILLVTHQIHFASQAADHVYFLDHGQVLESGGKAILSRPKNPRLKLFLSQVRSVS